MRTRWIVAIVLALLGVAWIAQGLGIAGGSSFMDNNRFWAVVGAILLVVAGAVAWTAVRMRRQV
jgi:drug/metabolite transporter (DMT)-like permease